MLGSTIRAACPSDTSTTRCKRYYPHVAQTNHTVALPSSPVIPSITMVYAESIGPCTDLKVDASGSSGSGGRPMYYYWKVTSLSDDANTTALEAYLERINPEVSPYLPEVPLNRADTFLQALTISL